MCLLSTIHFPTTTNTTTWGRCLFLISTHCLLILLCHQTGINSCRSSCSTECLTTKVLLLTIWEKFTSMIRLWMLIGAGFLIVIFMSVGPVSLQSSISDISTQSSLYLFLTTNQKQFFKISGHNAFKSLFLRFWKQQQHISKFLIKSKWDNWFPSLIFSKQ